MRCVNEERDLRCGAEFFRERGSQLQQELGDRLDPFGVNRSECVQPVTHEPSLMKTSGAPTRTSVAP
jgi:hypothetical protein